MSLLRLKDPFDIEIWTRGKKKDEPPPENVNRIPRDNPNRNSDQRDVIVVSRAVGGPPLAIPGLVLDAGSPFPNPLFHWGVLVGNYYHQLQTTNLIDGQIFYDNAKNDNPFNYWKTFWVGRTNWNDSAIVEADEEVIREMQRTYNVFNNNCQDFVIKLLNKICAPGRIKLLTNHGTMMVPEESEAFMIADKSYMDKIETKEDSVKTAETIMKENTPEVTEEELRTGKWKAPEGAIQVEPVEAELQGQQPAESKDTTA